MENFEQSNISEETSVPQEVETQETSNETQVTTNENTTQEVEQSTPQTVKVKYNHEEKEIPLDEAIQLAQKGMNYDKAIERERQTAKQEARDAYIAEQGYEWNGKPITTEAEYNQALREHELIQQYQSKGLPDEVVQELVESRIDREERKTEKEILAKREWEDNQKLQFLDYFQQENGRPFDASKDSIPESVWAEFDKGKSLVDAYQSHENQLLKAKIAEYEKEKRANEANKANASTSTGSVTGQGPTSESFISYETFETNKHDKGWVMKNFNKINESRAKW